MRLILLTLLLLSTKTLANNKVENNNQSELFLVGGGLKTCSSMSKSQCLSKTNDTKIKPQNVKISAQYRLSDTEKSQIFALLPNQYKKSHARKLKKLLNKAIKKSTEQPLTKRQMVDFLKRFDDDNIINKLSDPEYYLLLDALEMPLMDNLTGDRIKEKVELANSKNFHSSQIYREFVKRARVLSQKQTPTILVVTASARDSYEAVDFYLQAFEQAGAKSQWLPVDATLLALTSQTVSDRKTLCQQLPQYRLNIQKSAYRERVYPDLYQAQKQACLMPETLLNQVNQADGIFINGGDQSLTKQAFINNHQDSPVMKLIRERFTNDNIIIGGTSAGTAVMSGGSFMSHNNVMITNGQSDRAIFAGAKANALPVEGCLKSNSCDQSHQDDLTYNSQGGLGLFRLGILDTHFSERGRQGRLAQLLVDTQTQFAFGVDEATALIVDQQNRFRVVGQAGVFIIENTLPKNKMSEQEIRVNTHYLNQGDRGIVSGNGDLQLTFSSDKVVTQNPAVSVKVVENIFDQTKYVDATKLLCLTNNTTISGEVEYQGENAKVSVTKTKHSQSVQGVYQFGDHQKHDCSYTQYQLMINKENS